MPVGCSLKSDATVPVGLFLGLKASSDKWMLENGAALRTCHKLVWVNLMHVQYALLRFDYPDVIIEKWSYFKPAELKTKGGCNHHVPRSSVSGNTDVGMIYDMKEFQL